VKPTTHQTDLAKLPRALAPLIERPQWAIWRWTEQHNGRWQKPPFLALQPERHASTKDPSTWTNYSAALAAVQAGHGDGISYILTEADPFAAIDLDHCRDVSTNSINVWAQNFLDCGRHSYSEVTPSGSGCRIWVEAVIRTWRGCVQSPAIAVSLLDPSGHFIMSHLMSLSGVKRTWALALHMSASDPKRTLVVP